MAKEKIEVVFRTITPLWTGDAWQENCEIRPSSLMGSLRFWFAFYWKVIKNKEAEILDQVIGFPKENLSELEKQKQKTFQEILQKNLVSSNNFEEAIDNTLNELQLSVPSRIFGCTGWKSRVKIEIKNSKKVYIRLNDLDFNYPLNKINRNLNSKFWIKKVLFKDNEFIKLFKDVEAELHVPSYWWENYLKEFFEFFQDKIILVGGKNSFGFGFVNLSIKQDNTTEINTVEISDKNVNNKLIFSKIENIPYTGNKEVLGFNFKYFLRKKEKRQDREYNFGINKKASKIYVSNLLKNDNNSIFLLLLNNPFSQEKEINKNIFDKYKNWLINQRGSGDG
ncbi:MAG: type III-B CRISPR module RAMP protein Cmr1 [Hydrogenothermaceae bacterium]|nr:type III-B CRISPR module RAMP protein Cmr1 [Hydrogenothermaceae bacterium]